MAARPARAFALKILIIKPSSLGDVVHALPVLRLLRLRYPSARIHWWIDENLTGLLHEDPDLDEIILFERKRWRSPLHWPALLRRVQALRAERYDLVLDLQSLARTASLAWLVAGSLTAGLDDRREGAPAFFDISARRPTPGTHAVDWYLALLRELNIPVDRPFKWIPARPSAQARIRERFPDTGAEWIAIQPGARWENKRWPIEYFTDLAARIANRLPRARIAVLGAASERAACDRVARAAPERCENLAGTLDLGELIEWLRAAALLITNDTGPMHIAAALGRPIVALFGPTDPRRTGPYGQLKNVLQQRNLECVPCMKDRCGHQPYLECMRTLTPGAVLGEVTRVMNG